MLYDGIIEFEADGTVSQYDALKLSTGKVVRATAATDKVIGWAMYDAVAGAKVAVATQAVGCLEARVNATTDIAVGDELTAGADGKLIKYASGAGVIRVGRALVAATDDNDIIRIAAYSPQIPEDAIS
jgi:hypothetical protein